MNKMVPAFGDHTKKLGGKMGSLRAQMRGTFPELRVSMKASWVKGY